MVRGQERALYLIAPSLLLGGVLRVILSSTILQSRVGMSRSCAGPMAFMCKTWPAVMVQGSTMSHYTNSTYFSLAILFMWEAFALSILSLSHNELHHYRFPSHR